MVEKPGPHLLVKDMGIQSSKVLKSIELFALGYGNQTSQAVLLVGPLVLPRSFLTPSVILGIFMK